VKRILPALQVLLDTLMLVLAFVFGYAARQALPLFATPINPPAFDEYRWLMVIHAGTLLFIFFFARMYHQKRAVSRIDLLYSVAASVSVGVVMTNGLTGILLKGTGIESDYPRQMLFYVWLFSILCVIVGRELHRTITVWARTIGFARDRVLIIGSGDVAQTIIAQIRQNPQLGYTIVGAVNGNDVTSVGGVPIIGGTDQLPALLDEYRVDEVIIALPDATRKELIGLINQCQRGHISVKLYPDLFAYMAGGMSVDELGSIPLLGVRDVALRGWKLTLKRSLDVVGALFGLIFLSPFMLLTAILIRLESPGPIFFFQERVGLDGRPFLMIKFRSMRTDAEKHSVWTVKNDPRVTRIGKWMRRSNWDEIPNLINVLLGHMSLVGPRPEQTKFVQEFRAKIPRYMERHREKSGMTGWAQINGLRGDTSIEERLNFDLWYVEHWSLWLDIKIIIRTVTQTLLGKSENAY
jgi:exopolysaccharide biosynthesis polyprenyl glycosylphosphotransferase